MTFDKIATIVVDGLAHFGRKITPRGTHEPPTWMVRLVRTDLRRSWITFRKAVGAIPRQSK